MMSKQPDKLFINLCGVAKGIGRVTDAHLYGSGFISIKGTDDSGNKFVLSLTINKTEDETDGN